MAPNGLLKHYEIIECWRKKHSLVSHFEYLADIKKSNETRVCSRYLIKSECLSVFLDCSDPDTPSNGHVIVSTDRQVVTYSCDIWYTLHGSSVRYCQNDVTGWSYSEPVCGRYTCTFIWLSYFTSLIWPLSCLTTFDVSSLHKTNWYIRIRMTQLQFSVSSRY